MMGLMFHHHILQAAGTAAALESWQKCKCLEDASGRQIIHHAGKLGEGTGSGVKWAKQGVIRDQAQERKGRILVVTAAMPSAQA